MAALREYLAAQAELGTDEIILPQALARPAPVQAEKSRAPAGVTQAIPASAKALESPGDGSLLKMLNDSLRKGPVSAAPGTAVAPVKALEAPGPALPDFPSLEIYWRHVEKNLPALHGPEAGGVVAATGPQFAPLALVGLQPSADDAAAGKVFQGAAGELLAKMMRAIRFDLSALYLTSLVKAGTQKVWSRRELTRLLPWLLAELSLAKAPAVLLLGEACAQVVLKTGKPLEELRQAIHIADGRNFAVTYHPEDLLRKEDLKRKAWEDLQWLQRKLPGT